MCNIVDKGCHVKNCSVVINTHIGDFSVAPQNVVVFCRRHRAAGLRYIADHAPVIVFADDWEKFGDRKGELFIVPLPRDIGHNG